MTQYDSKTIVNELTVFLQNTMENSGMIDRFSVGEYFLPICYAILRQKEVKSQLVVGISGPQGSGKTTLSEILEIMLKKLSEKKVVRFSLDDLYKTKAERIEMATNIHPLFSTRGVPGTHDMDLGIQIFDQLSDKDSFRTVRIPVFDKSVDDRLNKDHWRAVEEFPDIILVEGWCLGAKPVSDQQLEIPVNELEMSEDLDGGWRKYSNEMLKGPYRELNQRIDYLIYLKINDFGQVYTFREKQEKRMSAPVMNKVMLARFIAHFERITRQMMTDLPQTADLVLQLDEFQDIVRIEEK